MPKHRRGPNQRHRQFIYKIRLFTSGTPLRSASSAMRTQDSRRTNPNDRF
jgi:hypothetical protein